MIEHLQTHVTGLLHVLAAVAAILAGTAVLLSRKGTRFHRWMGRCYVASMLVMYATAMLIYELFGRFGPFHWLVLASLATIVPAFVAVRRRRPGWKVRHAYLMAGSFVGLMAAAVAETASRVPGWSFGPAVIISSAAVIMAGIYMIFRAIPRILRQ